MDGVLQQNQVRLVAGVADHNVMKMTTENIFLALARVRGVPVGHEDVPSASGKAEE